MRLPARLCGGRTGQGRWRDPALRRRARRRAGRHRPKDRDGPPERVGAADFGGARQEREQRTAIGPHRPHDRVGELRLDRSRIAADIAGLDREARPTLSITGASPSSAAMRAPSIVADMTSSRSSWRKPCCTSRASASPRSASSERSWNSSNRTAAMPSSIGSSRTSRVKIPSVMISMRVRSRNFGAEAHPQPHRIADALAKRLRHPFGGGAGGEPARLQHQDPPPLRPFLAGEHERHPRGFARARRGDQHGCVFAAQAALSAPAARRRSEAAKYPQCHPKAGGLRASGANPCEIPIYWPACPQHKKPRQRRKIRPRPLESR